MSSGCNSLGCIDVARAPVRATYVNLYKWPESDAEFVKSVTSRSRRGDLADDYGVSRRWSREEAAAPPVDSFSCRQRYLRSYTFSRKETVAEKTLRCLGRVKERTAVFPFLQQRSEDSASSCCVNNGDHRHSSGQICSEKKEKKKKKKKKMMLCSTLYFIFRRLLSCTASVDVVERG